MKKEEVLEMSRKENKNKDMYEIEVENKGVKIAAILMLILATVYYCYEIFSGKGENYSFYSIIAIYCFSLYSYKAFKLEKRRILHVVCSFLWGIVTIVSIVAYFS